MEYLKYGHSVVLAKQSTCLTKENVANIFDSTHLTQPLISTGNTLAVKCRLQNEQGRRNWGARGLNCPFPQRF